MNFTGYRYMYIYTLIKPCCTSRLLWRHGRVFDYHPGDPGSIPVRVGSEDIFLYLSHLMSQGIGIYTHLYRHLYSLAVQAGFYGDAVECSTATREIRVRSPSGSGPKIFFFTCHFFLSVISYGGCGCRR